MLSHYLLLETTCFKSEIQRSVAGYLEHETIPSVTSRIMHLGQKYSSEHFTTSGTHAN
jgi:hypothetical protein